MIRARFAALAATAVFIVPALAQQKLRERCRLGRSPNQHLIFGNGVHFCLGARLARLELRVALEELLGRTKAFGLAGPEPTRFRWPGNGPRSLPLLITPA